MATTKGAWANFTTTCNICGVCITVKDGRLEPHHCRIDLDAHRH